VPAGRARRAGGLAGEYAMPDFNRDMNTRGAETLEGLYAVVTLQ
jgi:hypothetical protein